MDQKPDLTLLAQQASTLSRTARQEQHCRFSRSGQLVQIELAAVAMTLIVKLRNRRKAWPLPSAGTALFLNVMGSGTRVGTGRRF